MSNTKVLNCSSIRHPTSTATIRGVGDYSLRQSTVSQQASVKSKMMHVEEKTTTASRLKEIKKLNANHLSPLSSPQLIRSTRAKVAESNGWNASIKTKSSCSSGSNSVESIVPKYQIPMNTAMLSQKRSYLNQTTTTVNKFSNKTMSLRNDKSKKETHDSLSKKSAAATTAKKLLKPAYPSSSPTTSFSAKFPNGLPFENEFYHYRKNNHRSSVASDSTTSNNSSDEFTNHHRLSNSPYHDEFRRNPSNDALYVDFTLKSFDSFAANEEKSAKKSLAAKPAANLTTKTKYILTDKNCFCEFETVKSGESSPKSTNGQQQVDFLTAQAKRAANKDPVVYVTSANIFPKCNRTQPEAENAIKAE
jgi:hypothetical protein